MAPTLRQAKLFLIEPGAKYGTFSFDCSLPKLPVPTLEQTLAKYLASVEPFVSRGELETTKSICNNFKSSLKVQELHKKLLQRGQEKESWLHEWWLDYAYLYYREPLIPCLNVSGPYAATNLGPDQLWPVPVTQTQSLGYVAQFIYHMLQFWEILREERLKPDQARDGTRFNMQQFRHLFNTTRIPMKDKDEVMSLWVPRKEGNCPTHIVVMRKGHFFTFDPLRGDEPWTVPELQATFDNICQQSDTLGQGPGVAALTRDHRDIWAANREHLMKLDPVNLKSLELIESAMMIVVLDEQEPRSPSDNCQKLMTGLPANRWADKSLSLIQFANGYGGVNCDHSPMDAMVNVIMCYWVHLGIADMKGGWIPDGSKAENKKTLQGPIRLDWKLDSHLEEAISNANANAFKINNDIVVKREAFSGFGKNDIQKLKVNPDTFVQMGLQLAYYRLHGKPAPTYETATTRKYRFGRTETLRSCTNEAVAFVKEMDKIGKEDNQRKLLLKAIATHDKMMKEAKDGFGCDRHLLGISILSSLNGPEFANDPDIKSFFSNPAYFKSGGGGNYVLSTSTSGYTPMSGGATAMVLDGYGVFYNFEPTRIWIWVTNFRGSYETSVEKFWSSLESAFYDMANLLKSEKSKI